MGDTKAFTSIFNLVDNFTSKFDAIQKRVTAISDAVHPIDFDIGGDVLEKTKEIGKNLTESSEGIYKAASGAGKAAKSAGDGMKSAAEGAKGAKGEIEKSTSALEKMQSKMSGMASFTDTLKGKLGAITSLLTGSTIAGMAWSKAYDSASIADSFYRKMGRKNINTDELSAFIQQGAGLGYTTSSQRRDIADAVLSRTRLRGTKAQETTEAIEKLYFRDDTYWNKKGISSSADLADLLTKKTLSRYDKQLLADMGIKGGSASSRLRSAKKLSKGLTAEDVEAADPMAALQNRMGEFTSKMGKTLVDPMLKVLAVANRIIDVINSIPGAPNLVALGLVLVSASGAASLLATALAPLATVYSVLQKRMIAHAVTTQVLTVDEIMLTGATEAEAVAMVEANTASNLSWSAKLRLAAANIYASVATRAHSIATMANNAISWASAGAMAALATIYGVLTGSISLSTIAIWGLNTAMTVLNALNPFTYIIAGAAILAGIVGLVAYKSSLLGTIWKDLGKIKFGKIFDDLMKGDFSGAWKRLSKGMGTVWSDVKIGSSLLPAEISEMITGKLAELVRWVTTSFPFLSKIHEVIKKIHSIFEWIYSLWQGFWSWIKSAIPGAAKESKRKEMEKQAKREGLGITASGSIVELDTKGNPTAIGATGKASQKLLGLQTEYKNLPGFAEGIADAVTKGIASVGDTIAAKIKDSLPDFTPLTEVLTKLYDAIKNFEIPGIGKIGDVASVVTPESKVYWPIDGGGPITEAEWDKLSAGEKTSKYRYDSLGNPFEKHAIGATFTRGGMFRGEVHAPEEIIPQAIATKGPGPIARALEAFYGATTNHEASSVSEASRPVEVHVHSSYDFSGMRVSSAIDIEKLMRDIDRRITSGSVEAVKKAIGQGRT